MRGAYCGAVGVVGPPDTDVRARFSVVIRTVLVDRGRHRLSYGTIGGITWSSDPTAEYAELFTKAGVLRSRHEDFQLLETMLHRPGHGLRSVDAHLDRMADSARYFGIPFDPATARAVLANRTQGVGEARIRLRCSHDGTLAVDIAHPSAMPDRPVRLAVDPVPVDTTSCWSRH